MNLIDLCEKNNTFNNSINYQFWLDEIFNKLCDKEHTYTDKFYLHSYIPIYDKLFKKIKEKNINFLEIGIQKCGSINLFRTYFTNANIYGIDINTIPEWTKQLTNTNLFQEDAYNKNGLKLFNDIHFDIILDDGPHTLDSFIFLVENYLYKLNRHGILIIEDIQDIKWIDTIIKKIPLNIKYKYEIFDLREKKGRYDDIILIVTIL
jgi:hypothetical protein